MLDNKLKRKFYSKGIVIFRSINSYHMQSNCIGIRLDSRTVQCPFSFDHTRSHTPPHYISQSHTTHHTLSITHAVTKIQVVFSTL